MTSLYYFIRILFCMALALPVFGQNQASNQIQNNKFWHTVDGKSLHSQGGGIFRFADPETGVQKYYWYGAEYEESERYKNNPSKTLENATFKSVNCYTSTDLVNWTFENQVLTTEETNINGRPTWVGRLGVVYLKQLKQYAMFVQHGYQVMIAVADHPTEKFTPCRRINMESRIGTSNTGDQTVFTDEDTGRSYLIYSYGRGRHKVYVSEIGIHDGQIDLLDCTEIFKGAGREGNCMFKYKGKYYMVASNLYGWDSSFAYYLVADDIRGPYYPENNMLVMQGSEKDYAHVSQTGFFINAKGTDAETVIFCGDRWSDFAGNGHGYNQWCPLSFIDDVPFFNSLSSWTLDEKSATWAVHPDNNYVSNGSFEADRKHIPSEVKPIQEHLLGWTVDVLRGHQVSLSNPDSPTLNYFNTQDDREIVSGEKSLYIHDKVDFSRKVYQHITSTPFVALEDGLYKLSAFVKSSGTFTQLDIYAMSGGHDIHETIDTKNNSWHKVVMSNIPIKNGSVEIGFLAHGNAHSACYIDDVSLVRMD